MCAHPHSRLNQNRLNEVFSREKVARKYSITRDDARIGNGFQISLPSFEFLSFIQSNIHKVQDCLSTATASDVNGKCGGYESIELISLPGRYGR